MIARVAVPTLVTAFAVGTLTAIPSTPALASDYPGEDDIAAARAAASDAAATVADLDAAVAGLEAALADAQVAALIAQEDFIVAQEASTVAQEELAAAQKAADDADAALALARQGLAGAAMASYRNAGSMNQLEAITQANGFDEVITRHEAIDRASAEADVTVQEVRAAELVSETMRKRAESAATKAKDAEEAAATAAQDAEATRSAADQAVSDAAAAQSAAITRLAQLRGVTEELEQERQDGLAAERAARAQAEFEAEQERLEKEAENNASETSNNAGGSNNSGNTGSTSTPKPTATSTPKPTATSTSKPEPTETKTPEPEPTETQTPDPQPTETKTPEPKPTATKTPDPEPTTDPEPAPGWSSSASQGASAAAWAQTKVGAPYQLGGNGPAYDCSGLTMAAWSQAGHYITRSSRSQYQAVNHVSYSQIRPGDLVFWGSGKNASRIYHVAIYIGGGKVMEATTPGNTAKVRSMYNWAVGDMMPYVGRP